MSCLAALDEDDKDTDPEMNALTLLQEPVRMTQEALSYMDSFGKPSLAKQNGVLDVLSNADMLSPVGLGNGPSSHRATQAHDLNSLSTEKEEEKSITPLKTVQEIDTAGIWGFDVDSPADSLDDFSSAGDLQWDPHKEFMQFLWDDHDESPGEEMQKEVTASSTQKRRKRKMDMVVMVDPSEDLYPNLGHNSSEDSHEGEDQAHSVPMSKVRNLRMHSKSSSTENTSDYPNGTVQAIKQILYNAPTRNSFDNSISHRLSPLKGRLLVNSHSEPKPSSYPCSKCHLVFRKEISLQQHLELHSDLSYMSPRPFICQECGHTFRESSSLLEHMSVHPKRRKGLIEEINDVSDTNEAENGALCCPQCPFETNCQNTFVEHAKSHNKTKRYFQCEKCKFKAVSERGLRRHNSSQHKDSGKDEAGIFSCTICSYRAFSKNIFRNHLQCRHQLTIEKYKTIHRLKESETNAQLPVEKQASCKMDISETKSKILVSPKKDNAISDFSDLFKHEKMAKRCIKSQETQSKLDKSINVLLSRQRHDKESEAKRKKENDDRITSTHTNNYKNNLQDHLPGMPPIKIPETGSSSNDKKQFSVSKPDTNSCEYSVTEDDNSNRIPKPISDQAFKKTPSKRKMSTPFRNTTEQDSCFILPKHLPSPKMLNLSEEITNCDEKDVFQFKETLANTNLFDDDDVKDEETHIYTYSRRMSMRGVIQASKRLFDKITTDGNDEDMPDIKEECVETEVFRDSFESHSMTMEGSYTNDLSDMDPKSCPYCPEVFESGVGLSNHVRGHLHRVGLNYNERHVVPAEQVASQDKKPRMRHLSPIPQLEKAVQLEPPADLLENSNNLEMLHSCPLCGDSFDNRTGQSNHIRGHLKQLGRPIKSKNKTPLCLLRELMRDKKEVHKAIQILKKKRNKFSFRKSLKLVRSHPLTPPLTGLITNNFIPTICNDAKPHFSKPQFSLSGVASEKKQLETKLEVKGSLSSASALIGILKKRKCQEDSRIKGSSQMSKPTLGVCLNTEQGAGSRLDTSLQNSIAEKGEFNRKVCMHCNATFHSGVSLSNHLRAYAKRKRNALLDGAAIDCKGRRPRSRPGSKKKTLPLPQTPEEMYRLTCRFCDLVFQGPLSVQEDWIKHLQRHIMNTGVPHTGLSMVEVSMQSQEPSTPRPNQVGPSTGSHHTAS